jgi:hypothetical protein
MEEEGDQVVVLAGELRWRQRVESRGRVVWRWRR